MSHRALRQPGRLLLLVFSFWILAAPLHAHELKPALLEFRQLSPDAYAVLWKTSARDKLGDARPAFPTGTTILSDSGPEQVEGNILEHYQIRRAGGLAGQPVAVTGAVASLLDVLIRVVALDGSAQILRLTPDQPVATIAGTPSRWTQAFTFFRLGLEHILMGVDHLLFVLGLLLLVKSGWMLVRTITAFTIAHSITLGVATLGWANAPGPPLNAAIALSILFLGPEMVRARRGETSLAIRYPWIVAFAFGLLHGFGFASGLTALGLSRGEIPLALLLFNVGVEVGQLFFVGLILLLVHSWRVLDVRWPRWAPWLPPYIVGSLGAYWTIQRTLLLFTAIS